MWVAPFHRATSPAAAPTGLVASLFGGQIEEGLLETATLDLNVRTPKKVANRSWRAASASEHDNTTASP